MNEFYNQKASLPREVKNATSFREALEKWRDFRLLQVAELCSKLEDPFRKEYGKTHIEFAQSINLILEEKDARAAVKTWHNQLKENFEKFTTFNKGGPRIGAIGICGAELEKILKLELL